MTTSRGGDAENTRTTPRNSGAKKSAATPLPSRRQGGDSSGKSFTALMGNKGPRRHHATKKRPWGKRILWGLLWLSLIGIILAGIIFIASFYLIKVPSVDEAVRAQRSVVYYADGKEEIGSLSRVNRRIIDTTKIPKYVGLAVVASEDRTFFENNGVDLKGIARAFWNNLRGGKRQGASTLTQQYVENYYTGSRGGYIGKYREAILALKINQTQTKQEILNNYLNTIYFGRSAYGIEAAARAYFDKSAKDLTVSEAAMIAGIIPAPSSWDPAKNRPQAERRWERVIKLMAEDGWITPQQKQEAKFPKFIEKTTFVQRAGNSGYLLDQVSAEAVKDAGMDKEDLKNGGYRIVTTVVKARQDEMEQTIKDMPKGASPNLHVGMISVDNATGGILAEYPGSDYAKSQRNIVTEDTLHPGSTFKPFTLMAALEEGKTIYNTYSGSSPASFPGLPNWHPSNFGGISYGRVTLRKATALSINTAYLRLNYDLGASKTKDMAINMGIPADTVGLDDALSNTLGTCSVHLIDLAQAYTTLANYGSQRPVHIIREIRDSNNKVVYSAPTKRQQVLDPNIAKNVLIAMGDVVAYGSGENAQIRGWRPAGKTGTSNDNKSAVFVGLVPQVTTVVGMFQTGKNGAEDTITPFGGYREITGGSIPSELWKDYMDKALKDLTPERFERPQRTVASFDNDTAPAQEKESPEETPEKPKQEAPQTADTQQPKQENSDKSKPSENKENKDKGADKAPEKEQPKNKNKQEDSGKSKPKQGKGESNKPKKPGNS
ncbi:transglycosylase domain-containing protein [Actinomycetaceae bacterium TAE3-ERU4]|nr:transglycosylase domain-containing protein [Actinomycetaceae bacterium TAE3-ERU4]